jgi:fatty-acyl-CoA synthase
VTFLRIDQIIAKPRAGMHGAQDSIAVVTETASYTFAELDERARRLAGRLRELGVRRGDRILVLMHNRIEWIDVYFAAAKLRAVIVPANYFFVESELDYLLDDSGATVVVSEEALAARLDHRSDVVRLIADATRPGWTTLDVAGYPDAPELDHEAGAAADEPFLLQYTSGTTGRPKAAIHTHATIMFNLIQQVAQYGMTDRDVYLLVVAFAWVAGFHAYMLPTLLAGGRVVVQPNHAIDPEQLAAALERHGATITGLAPVVLARLAESDRLDPARLGALRMIISGGAPCPEDLIRLYSERLPGCAVIQALGMSEGPFSGVNLPADQAIARVGSVGRGGLTHLVRVVDEAFEDVAAGEIGEIVVRSPGVAVGYWRRPEETAEAFVDGWFRTGDLARIDGDGYVFITGRSKDMIISGGLNVYPVEVEQALLRHPAVADVAVVGMPDPRWGETPVAVVVRAAPATAAELDEFARLHVAKYKVPTRWVFVEDPLPRTFSGKVQKFKIRERLAADADGQ